MVLNNKHIINTDWSLQ